MLFKGGVVLAALSMLGLFSVSAKGESKSIQEKVPYFSNEDVERYKMPSDDKAPGKRVNSTETAEEKAREKKEQLDRENWCKRANSYKRKIERAQDEISEIEKDFSAEKMSQKKKIALDKKLRKAEKKKEYAEKDFADLEEEARRKDVPPGWLRCQFE
jgi:hypothetical protein